MRTLALKLTLLIVLLGSIGCANINPKQTLEPNNALDICYSYGCKTIQQVSLSDEQWLVIKSSFSPTATNAKQERTQIANAIANMEKIIGEITHTKNDLPGTFAALFSSLDDQMDCVDEATNTTLYLKHFRELGLVRFHREDHRINRGFFFNGWPHTSAVIENIETGERFAVDSWFHKNGIEPEIIPVKLWYSGWHPEPKN